MRANTFASRTVNHEAIKRREARIKAQHQAKASQEEQKKPQPDAARQALGEDLFRQIFNNGK